MVVVVIVLINISVVIAFHVCGQTPVEFDQTQVCDSIWKTGDTLTMCRVYRLSLSGIFGNIAVSVCGQESDVNLADFIGPNLKYIQGRSPDLSFNGESGKCYVGPAVLDHHTVIEHPAGMRIIDVPIMT